MTKNTLLLLGAAVAGPALIVAGARYPGSTISRAFLVSAGLGVTGASYYYFKSDMKGYVPGVNSALVPS